MNPKLSQGSLWVNNESKRVRVCERIGDAMLLTLNLEGRCYEPRYVKAFRNWKRKRTDCALEPIEKKCSSVNKSSLAQWDLLCTFDLQSCK